MGFVVRVRSRTCKQACIHASSPEAFRCRTDGRCFALRLGGSLRSLVTTTTTTTSVRSIYLEETKAPPMAIISRVYMHRSVHCSVRWIPRTHERAHIRVYGLCTRAYTHSRTLARSSARARARTRTPCRHPSITSGRPSWILANQNNSIHNSMWASERCLVPTTPLPFSPSSSRDPTHPPARNPFAPAAARDLIPPYNATP